MGMVAALRRSQRIAMPKLSQDTDHEDELREAFKVVRRVLQAVTHCTCNSLMLRCFKTALVAVCCTCA